MYILLAMLQDFSDFYHIVQVKMTYASIKLNQCFHCFQMSHKHYGLQMMSTLHVLLNYYQPLFIISLFIRYLIVTAKIVILFIWVFQLKMMYVWFAISATILCFLKKKTAVHHQWHIYYVYWLLESSCSSNILAINVQLFFCS